MKQKTKSLKTTNKRSLFLEGALDGIPIGLGYLSVSFAFGIFSVGSGLSIIETVLISMLNVTSAGQLAAVPIIVSLGTYIELIMTQLVINLRYSLMSTSLSQKLSDDVRLRDRFLVAFMNTDEVFAVGIGKSRPLERRYLFGLILPPYLGWTLGTLVGALLGNVLPVIVISALGIAIYGMFIAIVVPVARDNRRCLFAVIVAIILSLLFYYLPVLSEVPSGFSIIICACVSAALFALIMPIEEEEADA